MMNSSKRSRKDTSSSIGSSLDLKRASSTESEKLLSVDRDSSKKYRQFVSLVENHAQHSRLSKKNFCCLNTYYSKSRSSDFEYYTLSGSKEEER